MVTLILPLALGTWAWGLALNRPLRDAVLKALVLLGAAAVVLTEALSSGHRLDQESAAIGWVAVVMGAVVFGWIRRHERSIQESSQRLTVFEASCLLAILGIIAIVGYAAVLSPPNSADAMAYHLPRVIYWIQAKSVAFFPTSYLN